MSKIGDRVGAILGSKGKIVEFIGYGIYEGNFLVGPEAAGELAKMCQAIGHENPRILLDSGERVWGCECWWGSESEVKKRLSGYEVKIVTPAEFRAEWRKEGL
jgi:hypothetical protein